MPQDRWSRAHVIMSVILAAAGAGYGFAHLKDTVPAQRQAEQALLDKQKLEAELGQVIAKAEIDANNFEEMSQKYQACQAGKSVPPVNPIRESIPDAADQTAQCQKIVDQWKTRLQDSEASAQALREQMDDCWARCKSVTPKNFSLHKGDRQTVWYGGREYGLTFVDWANRDSKDVNISIDTVGHGPAVVLVREGKSPHFELANKRFVIASQKAERVNDRVWITVEETD